MACIRRPFLHNQFTGWWDTAIKEDMKRTDKRDKCIGNAPPLNGQSSIKNGRFNDKTPR